MRSNRLHFTGERLVPNSKILASMRTEDLARYHFFSNKAHGRLFLDLGCGVGEGTAYLGQSPHRSIIGIDIASDAIAFACQHHSGSNISFAQMDAQQLGFVSNYFDSIISVEVIEHIHNPSAYLSEIARILRLGGFFMLTTPNRLRSSPTPGSLWPDHVREFDPNELIDLLKTKFQLVELLGESIAVYETHPVRKLVQRLAPSVKPWLPRWLRVRALPIVQTLIKANLELDDVHFSQIDIEERPTLVALCHK